jgi:acetylornithine deacetylase/succinyl-diaminopimelate desuccinylase-like protein
MVRVSPPIPLLAGDVGAALYEAARATAAEVLSLAAEIARVPAPTNNESLRSDYILSLMDELGFVRARVDELGDVTGVIPGVLQAPQILIAGHIDTVFPNDTPLSIHVGATQSTGPGIGDNSLGVAAALKIPAMLARSNIKPATDVIVTGDVGEEGLGDLRGMKAVMDAHPDVGAVIALEGHNLGRVTHVAVGSRRYQVTVTGAGGHSWGDYGNTNAIHAVAEIINRIVGITLPANPKTTLNVGMIEGGISINTIAPSASFLLDVRSVDGGELDRVAEQIEAELESAAPDVEVSFDIIGERPAGIVQTDSRIIRLASSILESIGIQPVGDASSTDANIPISRGIPAVCIGLTTGGNVHREDEFIDNGPIADGLYQMLALTVTVSAFLSQDQL